MESSEYVRSKLVNYTNASDSTQDVKHSRYHYFLYFKQQIGKTWLDGQINKLSGELDVNLEIWKIGPADDTTFELEVREIDRRPHIDDEQHGLTDFEEGQ